MQIILSVIMWSLEAFYAQLLDGTIVVTGGVMIRRLHDGTGGVTIWTLHDGTIVVTGRVTIWTLHDGTIVVTGMSPSQTRKILFPFTKLIGIHCQHCTLPTAYTANTWALQ